MAQKPSDIKTEKYYTKDKSKTLDDKWWKLDDKDVAAGLYPMVKDIERRQMARRTSNLRHARLYQNMEILGLNVGMFSRTATEGIQSNRVTLNVVASCIDTIESKIAKNRPKAMFLTEGGSWSQANRAKQLTKYVDGAMDSMGFHIHNQMAFKDSCIFGTGGVKFFIEDYKVKCERVMIDEIIVDDADAIYGTPQQIHQVRYVQRDKLKEVFPKYEKQIKDASPGLSGEAALSAKDILRVTESWHLKSGPSAKDGRHAIVIDECTLHVEEYEKDYFPFIWQTWKSRVTGFFGSGIAEEITGIQLEINKLLRRIQRAQHLMAVPRVFIDNASAVNQSAINNNEGTIVGYTGQPPIFNTAPAMSQEVYSHLENLYQKAFQIVGVSQLSAQSQKPAGLNSGAALREYNDIETDRFQMVGQKYETTTIDAAAIIVDKSKDLYSEKKDLSMMVRSNKFIEQIKWKDVDMEKDEYILRVFPISMLPTTPAGKLQTVTELVQAGFVDKEMAMSLLDFPDVESFVSLKTANLEDTRRILGLMIEKGQYNSPEPFMDLDLALSLAQSTYLKSRMDAVPEDRLELIRRFIEDVQSLQIQANSQTGAALPPNPQPDAVAAMEGQPTGVPQAPPEAELMQSAPTS